MTPAAFHDWRTRRRLSQQAAAAALGLGRSTIQNYERGERPDGGEAKIPKAVRMAMAAMDYGIADYDGVKITFIDHGKKPQEPTP